MQKKLRNLFWCQWEIFKNIWKLYIENLGFCLRGVNVGWFNI